MKRLSLLLVILFALALIAALSSCTGGSGGNADSGIEAAPQNDYSFLVCGDPHGRTDLLDRIAAQARPGEFLVVVGDVTTGTGLQEMQKMKTFLDSTGLTYHVIPGDNDMPGGAASDFRHVFGADYYSLDFQDSHLVFLDDAMEGTGCPADELSWLQQDLAGAAGKVVIAFAHVPPGAPVEMSDAEDTGREVGSGQQMLALLRDANCAVVYSGHLHAYLVYSSGPPRIIVTGGAGAHLHLSPENGGYYHFLRVTVKGGQVTEEVIRL
jgi:3',5'-cyclic AMP phosphodiesterase CpdA